MLKQRAYLMVFLSLMVGGSVMADSKQGQLKHGHPSPKFMGIEAFFPTSPVDTRFEIPFTEGGIEGTLSILSAPFQDGVCVLAIVQVDKEHVQLHHKDVLTHLVERAVVPALFFQSHVFNTKEWFANTPNTIPSDQGWFNFHSHYQYGGLEQNINGKWCIRDNRFICALGIFGSKSSNSEMCQRFLDSVDLPE